MALLQRNEYPDPAQNYDCIIIGGGMGGLTTAAVLAKHQRKVLMLEGHNKLGGLATWFYRDHRKLAFDVSLHGFPFAMIKTVRRYWPKNLHEKIHRIPSIEFTSPKHRFSTTYDQDDVCRVLTEEFCLSSSRVDAFFAYAEQSYVGETERNETVNEVFQRFFPDNQDVIPFLLGPICFANGTEAGDLFSTFAIVFLNFMRKGIWTFKGGTDLVISELRSGLLDLGVDIKLNCSVEQILIHNNQARGVGVKGQRIFAKAVVSNAHIHSTIEKLLPPSKTQAMLQHELQKVEINTSSTQVYLAFNEKLGGLTSRASMIFDWDDWSTEAKMMQSFIPQARTFTIYRPDEHQHSFCENLLIVVTANARYEDWSILSPEDYRLAKEEILEQTLKALDRREPGLKNGLCWSEVSTPLTIEKFTKIPQGASYGTKAGGLALSKKLSQAIAGLFHVGSVDIIMSGWLGTANSAVMQSLSILSFLDHSEQAHEVSR